MKKYVIDTSVFAKLFIKSEEGQVQTEKIFERAINDELILIAPFLLIYELNNVFVKGHLTRNEIEMHFSTLNRYINAKVIYIFRTNVELLLKASDLAGVDTGRVGYISSYDATFHALAILENAIFITDDVKHYNKTADRFGSIMLLKDFQ